MKVHLILGLLFAALIVVFAPYAFGEDQPTDKGEAAKRPGAPESVADLAKKLKSVRASDRAEAVLKKLVSLMKDKDPQVRRNVVRVLVVAMESENRDVQSKARFIANDVICGLRREAGGSGEPLGLTSIPLLEKVVATQVASLPAAEADDLYVSMRSLCRISFVIRTAKTDPALTGKLEKAWSLLQAAGPPLLELAKPGADKNRRVDFIDGIGKIGVWAAAEKLLPYLKEKGHRVRCATIRALGFIGNPVAFKPVIAMLNDPAPGVRGWVPFAMSWLEPKKAKARILEVLRKDESSHVRRKALMFFSRLKDAEAVAILGRAITSGDDKLQGAAILALKERPKEQRLAAAGEIIRALPKLKDEELLGQAHYVLRKLTGLNKAKTPEEWKAWWEENKGK